MSLKRRNDIHPKGLGVGCQGNNAYWNRKAGIPEVPVCIYDVQSNQGQSLSMPKDTLVTAIIESLMSLVRKFPEKKFQLECQKLDGMGYHEMVKEMKKLKLFIIGFKDSTMPTGWEHVNADGFYSHIFQTIPVTAAFTETTKLYCEDIPRPDAGQTFDLHLHFNRNLTHKFLRASPHSDSMAGLPLSMQTVANAIGVAVSRRPSEVTDKVILQQIYLLLNPLRPGPPTFCSSDTQCRGGIRTWMDQAISVLESAGDDAALASALDQQVVRVAQPPVVMQSANLSTVAASPSVTPLPSPIAIHPASPPAARSYRKHDKVEVLFEAHGEYQEGWYPGVVHIVHRGQLKGKVTIMFPDNFIFRIESDSPDIRAVAAPPQSQLPKKQKPRASRRRDSFSESEEEAEESESNSDESQSPPPIRPREAADILASLGTAPRASRRLGEGRFVEVAFRQTGPSDRFRRVVMRLGVVIQVDVARFPYHNTVQFAGDLTVKVLKTLPDSRPGPDATWWTLSSDPYDSTVVSALKRDAETNAEPYQSRLCVGDVVLHTLTDSVTNTATEGLAEVLAVGVHSALVQVLDSTTQFGLDPPPPGYVTLRSRAGGPPFDVLHRTNPGPLQRHLRKLTAAEAAGMPPGTIDRAALEGIHDADGPTDDDDSDGSCAEDSPGAPPILPSTYSC